MRLLHIERSLKGYNNKYNSRTISKIIISLKNTRESISKENIKNKAYIKPIYRKSVERVTNRSCKRYTIEEDNELLDLWSRGDDAEQIASTLGRSTNSIFNKHSRLVRGYR